MEKIRPSAYNNNLFQYNESMRVRLFKLAGNILLAKIN